MSTIGSAKTDRSSRYLQQVCKHWSHRFTVNFDHAQGAVDFQDGSSLFLTADEHALLIRIVCPSDSNDLLKTIVVEHIDRFAHQEGKLEYEWIDGSFDHVPSNLNNSV